MRAGLSCVRSIMRALAARRSMLAAVPLRHDAVLMAQRDAAVGEFARRRVIGGIADAAARRHRDHLLDREPGLVPDLDLVGQVLAWRRIRRRSPLAVRRLRGCWPA